MEFAFASYDEFLEEYKTYRFDECGKCNGICELVENDITCIIENRSFHFVPLLVLRCKKCGAIYLPEHSKQMIDGVYKTAVKENQTIGEFHKLSVSIHNMDIASVMSPLYILHDYRILLDHLLSADKISETKEHIINTLGVQNFDDQKTIYIEEIKRLNTLFNYLAILSK